MKAMRPGPPSNGAISATLDIGRAHRLQAICDDEITLLPLKPVAEQLMIVEASYAGRAGRGPCKSKQRSNFG
jgi:hypothetical protein